MSVIRNALKDIRRGSNRDQQGQAAVAVCFDMSSSWKWVRAASSALWDRGWKAVLLVRLAEIGEEQERKLEIIKNARKLSKDP
jgi:hypothetical protein